MKKLAIVTSHPIQYNAPWFRMLAESKDIKLMVYYTWGASSAGSKYDPGFGKVVEWDIPLFDGYEYTFVENMSVDPGTHHYKGIVNPELQNVIKKWKPDAVLVFGWNFKSHLSCIRHFHGKIPVIFRGDSTLLDEKPGIKKLLRRYFLTWVYRHVDYALYTGSNNKVYFKAHGLKDHQLLFAPHAIDNRRFSDADGVFKEQAAKWRKELGYSENDIVVLFAGKLEPKKDPGIIIELAKAVTDNKVKFLLVGNGQLEQELKEKAGVMNNVQFLDFQNQTMMPVVHRLGDIFLLPSVGPGETWGLAINEAMACGLPVIASSKAGGAKDLVKPGENGYIFSAGDLNDLQHCLKLCTDRNAIISMGKRSLEIISNYNFNSIVKTIRSILFR